MHIMNTSQIDTSVHSSAAKQLGMHIRSARKNKGWTIAQLAENIGRPREWQNRVELGYSELGEFGPPSSSDLGAIIGQLAKCFDATPARLHALREEAQNDFSALRNSARKSKRNSGGKLTQAEVIIGEEQISQAIIDLINEQHSDAVIRNTGVRGHGATPRGSSIWDRYRETLGDFIAKNPSSTIKRIEYVGSNSYLEMARQSDLRLAGDRQIQDVHNAKVKFLKHNPFQLHVLIGQREAIIALPKNSGLVGSNMALLVRDKLFVEALRMWYDEVLWDTEGATQMINFSKFEESFDEVRRMYGFDS